MSRAFVKESDGADDEELAELQVSPHRNLVTAEGYAQIEAMVERLRAELSAARSAEDRAGIKRIQRDLRYWAERQRTAELVKTAPPGAKVRFGSTATLQKADGTRVEFGIVGEDEADPANGKISYVSPIAKLLIGASVGDEIALPDGTAEITAIH
jgi:transcription elongation GreA/GreB family factor